MFKLHLRFYKIITVSALHYIAAKIIDLLAHRDNASIATKTYYAQFLINTRPPCVESFQLLEEIINIERHHPTSVVVWPRDLRMSVDRFVRTELDFAAARGVDDFLVIPSLVYAYYILAKMNVECGAAGRFHTLMSEFEATCHMLCNVFPISMSLLGYVYQQAGHHQEAIGAFSRAADIDHDYRLALENVEANVALLSNQLQHRDRVPNEPSIEFKHQREYARTMDKFAADFAEPYFKSFSPVFFEYCKEYLDIFDNGRSDEDCLICRMSD